VGESGIEDDRATALAHRGAPALLVGPAGSGRSELIATRFAALVAEGHAADRILVGTNSRSARAHLRERIDALLDSAYEELWVDTWPRLAERLLRDRALEAGIDPFFEVAGPSDRLAILLERVDDLPLRRHEIRGNPAGLLVRLLERVDLLKSEGIGPAELRERARAAERGAAGRAERERALRELEFADLYERHDTLLVESGAIDERELVLELGRLLARRPDVAAAVGERFGALMVDELEDAGRARCALLPLLAPHRELLAACDPDQGLRAFRFHGEAAVTAFRAEFPGARTFELTSPRRGTPVIRAVTAAMRELVPDSYRAGGEDRGPAPEPVEPGATEPPSVRLWRCENERAQAQAVAREIEELLADGACMPGEICVIAGPAGREERLIAAALEERNVPFRRAGSAALFQRPEVRDVVAWLRALADPTDSAAVVRALTRPPVELPSVDLARCTTIARRRKLDMVSALEAALESPQLPPPSRDRIRAFLKLYRAAAGALDGFRADVFVRRLIERIGFRRHSLFAASPETAQRLVSLARLSELAGGWSRRRPAGSTREFVRYLSAVAEAGTRFSAPDAELSRDAVLVAEPGHVKGLEFERVYLVGLEHGALRGGADRAGWIDDELLSGELPPAGPDVAEALRARRAYVAVSRARGSLVLAYPQQGRSGAVAPSPVYAAARAVAGVIESEHEEELFGPAEGLHATYRIIRDEVLEASWRAGAALSEMRLDTAEDVNRAIARYLEMLKLAALIQRPGEESEREALAALNELLGRVATPEQRAELERSSLDSYIVEEAASRDRRRRHLARQGEPGLEAFLPTRGEGLALSASDVELYRTCPLKYKFARVFAIPQEPTINQRFGILVHNVLERYHSEELRGFGGEGEGRGGLDRLLALFEAGWRRTGFGNSDDELQYRDRAVAALARYLERHNAGAAQPVWLERGFSFEIGEHSVRGRVDRVDRHPDGSLELIDYKTGAAKTAEELADDVQIALYRIGARSAWDVEAADGSYWYVLDDEKVPVGGEADDLERVERTVLEVAAGIGSQDFEPRPDFATCSWCDYRLICPASEA
jgi:DNA helicase II / ATP-dependent DNA helicase PcrA